MARLKIRLVVERDDEKTANALPVEPGKAAAALSRQLRITAVTLVLSLGMIIAVTVAWFAMNRDVESAGMQMEVEAPVNLIIEDMVTLTTAATTANDGSTYLDIFSTLEAGHKTATFGLPANTKFVPASHNTRDDPTSASGLIYSANGGSVNPFTGYEDSISDIISFADKYPEVAYSTDNTSSYYRDVTLLVASAGRPLTAAEGKMWTLIATFPEDTANQASFNNPDPNLPHQSAASVDFYVSYVGEDAPNTATGAIGTYVGTLNLAGQDYRNTTTSGTLNPLTQIDLFKPWNEEANADDSDSKEPITVIPSNTANSSNCFYITLRIYFDGNLQHTTAATADAAHDVAQGDQIAYINTAQVTADNITMKVHFEAQETEIPTNNNNGG